MRERPVSRLKIGRGTRSRDQRVASTTTTGPADMRREFFKNSYPTSTGVLVLGFLRKETLIEISAVAVLRGNTK